MSARLIARTTQEQRQALQDSIRSKLRAHLRPPEIILSLKNDGIEISRATLFRHLADLREEDRKWLNDQAKGAFTSSYRLALESLENQIRELILIRQAALKPSDKIAATLAIAEIEEKIIDLTAEGPTVFAVQENYGRPQVDKIEP